MHCQLAQAFDATRFQITDEQIALLAKNVVSQNSGGRGFQLQATGNAVSINVAVVRRTRTLFVLVSWRVLFVLSRVRIERMQA